jgi:hypothetical protein
VREEQDGELVVVDAGGASERVALDELRVLAGDLFGDQAVLGGGVAEGA